MEADEGRVAFVAGLRELADFLESRPAMRVPYSTHVFYVITTSPEEFAEQVTALGTGKKGTNGAYIDVTRQFGPFELAVSALHTDVCERKVIGTRTVEKQVPPAGVEMVTVTEEQEIVEWICPDSLLAGAAAVSA